MSLFFDILETSTYKYKHFVASLMGCLTAFLGQVLQTSLQTHCSGKLLMDRALINTLMETKYRFVENAILRMRNGNPGTHTYYIEASDLARERLHESTIAAVIELFSKQFGMPSIYVPEYSQFQVQVDLSRCALTPPQVRAVNDYYHELGM